MISLLAWIATVGVLLAYFLSDKYGAWLFDWSNAVLCIPLCINSLQHGNPQAAGINFAFGLIALNNIRKRHGKN